MRRYAGNAGNFRQPSFGNDGYRRNAGRGANMTQPAWQSRSYHNGGDGSFGSFGGDGGGRNFRQDGPSMTAPVTAEEMNSPARDHKGKGREIRNMHESGHNRPVTRNEIEQWINEQCETSFAQNRSKVDCMVEFFTSSKSASSSFRYLQKVRGPKFFGTYSNYFIAFDCEMMDAGLHDFTAFLQDTLFPKSGERPLDELSQSIPDIIRSEQLENALTRQFRSNSEFCGGSDYYQAKIEQLRELRRKHPKMKDPSKQAEACSSTSAANPFDVSQSDQSDSPEMSKKDMVKMLKMQQEMLKKLATAEAVEDATTSVSANTRSSEKKQKKQKRSK